MSEAIITVIGQTKIFTINPIIDLHLLLKIIVPQIENVYESSRKGQQEGSFTYGDEDEHTLTSAKSFVSASKIPKLKAARKYSGFQIKPEADYYLIRVELEDKKTGQEFEATMTYIVQEG